MDSVDSLDNVHGLSGQSPGSSGRLDNAHGLCPLSPWTKSKVQWTMSMVSLDKVQGTRAVPKVRGHYLIMLILEYYSNEFFILR